MAFAATGVPAAVKKALALLPLEMSEWVVTIPYVEMQQTPPQDGLKYTR